MIIDASSLSNNAVVEADVCIVGAGAAGITLARRLSGNGLKIVLVEGVGAN